MFKKADRLTSAMNNGKHPAATVVVDPMEEMLLRAEKLAQEMKGEPLLHDDPPKTPGDNDDPIDNMLAKAGTLAAQMRITQTPIRGAKSLVVSTYELPPASKQQEVNPMTPKILPTVSMDDASDGVASDGVDTMLLKAELLSKTIRSAANGQIDTPELMRASDEILLRAKVKEGKGAIESTPDLLAKAKRILATPLEKVMSADLTAETQNDSTETDPVRNQTPASLLNRPPRPPTQRSSITPSPKGTQLTYSPLEADKEPSSNHEPLARAIEALQSVPTRKSPDSPSMPKSVALQLCDSDDMSSVGSGSFMRNMSASNLLHTSTQSLGGGGPPTANVTTTGNHPSVAYAEGMAKQMANALEETLSCASSVGVDLQSPQQPRKLMSLSLNNKKNQVDDVSQDHSFSSNMSQGKVNRWEKDNYPEPMEVRLSNDMLRRRRLDANVKWETVRIPKTTDEDYAPMEDFRNCRSLGVGAMPAKSSKKRQTKRKKLIGAFVIGTLCLVIGLLAAKLWYNNSSSVILEQPQVTKRVVKQQVKAAQRERPVEVKSKPIPPPKKVKTAAPFQTSIPTEKKYTFIEKKLPAIEKKAPEKVPKKTAPTVQREPPVVKKIPVVEAPVKEVTTKPAVAEQAQAAQADSVPVDGMLASLKKSLGAVVESPATPEKVKVPKRCLVPLGYIVSSKCREIAREQPLVDVKGLVDSMMQ